jgi:hypothetical protein
MACGSTASAQGSSRLTRDLFSEVLGVASERWRQLTQHARAVTGPSRSWRPRSNFAWAGCQDLRALGSRQAGRECAIRRLGPQGRRPGATAASAALAAWWSGHVAAAEHAQHDPEQQHGTVARRANRLYSGQPAHFSSIQLSDAPRRDAKPFAAGARSVIGDCDIVRRTCRRKPRPSHDSGSAGGSAGDLARPWIHGMLSRRREHQGLQPVPEDQPEEPGNR